MTVGILHNGVRVVTHTTPDIDDHQWVPMGLAEYHEYDQFGGVIRKALVLGCGCGRSRWVKSEPTWPIEEMPR